MAKRRGILDSIAESIIRPIVVGYLDRYSQDLNGLRTAIWMNIDIYQLWCDNYENEGIKGPDFARGFTRMAPKAKNLLTTENVRKWLIMEEKFEIIQVIDSTAGGREWFDGTITKFREELWRDFDG